jgi:hypothetical protein
MDKEDLTWTRDLLPVRIEEWSTNTYGKDSYMAPELCFICLHGTIYNHPTKPDGSRVRTSRIIKADGNIINTENTEYELGKPDPEFIKWLNSQGRTFDPKNPIKFIK